jgi:type VI secretion system protein ImpK
LHFHQERDGSDRVFHLLSRLQQDPRRHRHLLELMQAVFDLGFQGRYGQMTGGARQLEALRQRLASQLPAAGTAARPKSAAAQRGANAVTARPRRPRLWVWIPVALATLLLGLVLAYGWHDARPEASAGFSREAGPATPASVTGPALDSAPAGPRLRGLLKSDLDSGRVELHVLADHSTLMLRGDRLFGAESADLLPAAAPLLARIGDALRQFPGRVVISGHTDNLPIHTERFPSNWHLSKERASSVKRALAEQLAAGRLAVEGRADTEPVADNGAPEGRAMNSRIEITLHAPASVSAP